MINNSFSETVNNLVKQVNIALDSLAKLNESMTTKDDQVAISVIESDSITGQDVTNQYAIPSYNKVLDDLQTVKFNMEAFIAGSGTIRLDDGSYRKIITEPVAIPPSDISALTQPTEFTTKSNWFFESLMFPQLVTQFELKGKIDDTSDRVYVKRIIFDNFSDTETQWFKSTFVGQDYTYVEVLDILNQNSKDFWEDEEVKELPLYSQPYVGTFKIVGKSTVSSVEYYTLNTIMYGENSDASIINNTQLSIGTQLRYNNTIFSVKSINPATNQISVTIYSGIDTPTMGGYFYIYNTPFSSKILDIGIGYNECNILFIKGINDNYNLLSNGWGNSISFYTNDLTLKDSTTTFDTYYNNYVADFGLKMEGEAKEKPIPAFYGVTPDAPVITASQFKVSQVNTQINAALDTTSVKDTQAQIESAKSIINSLKTTLAQQKADLVELTDTGSRTVLQAKITANTNELSRKTVEYSSLVRSLSTIAYENSAVISNPKYRIRGFFNIPNGKTATASSAVQEIIGFDIAYRYLKLDDTGTPLDTYIYTDPSTNQPIKGVFSDWIIVTSPIRTKSYDNTTGVYVWNAENISDGDAVNINQLDIPIQKGEKVQIKIRSISEAGYPINPLRSDWCTPVTVEFPSNLTSSDQVADILTSSVAEETTIKLDETLASSGVTTHISDSIPNPASGTGTYFNHQAKNLAYEQKTKDGTGTTTATSTSDIQSLIDDFTGKIYTTVFVPDGSVFSAHTSTLQKVINELIRCASTSFNVANI